MAARSTPAATPVKVVFIRKVVLFPPLLWKRIDRHLGKSGARLPEYVRALVAADLDTKGL
jgi:hypothetical protein